MSEQTTWGSISRLKYGKALPHKERTANGHVTVFGTNGPIGYANVSQGTGPTVVVGRKGAYRGVHYCSGPFWVIDTAFYMEFSENVHPKWAYYSLLITDINGLASGSAIPSTTREDFYALPVRLPSLKEQEAVAGVLSALDDKIARNTALAETADELARALFSESVRGIKVSDKTFDDVATVGGGGTPSSRMPEYWGGDIRWATPTDVTALEGPYLFDTERRISEPGLASCSSRLYPAGSILMTSRATIGAFALAQEATAVNQGFIVVVPGGDVPAMWLFHEMRSRVPEFTSMANGATFLELSRGNFKKFGVRLAEPEVMARFDERARALHDRAAAALKENTRLKVTRDALLPGLMSGKLRVRDAERVAEEVA